MNPFANGVNLDLVLNLLKRRLWLVSSVFCLLVAVIGSVLSFLPDVYTVHSSIMVEGQQIPQDYVRTTVTMGLERRLRIISQKILSRAQILETVQKFNLYEDLRGKEDFEDRTVAAMRRDVGIQVKGRGGDNTVVFEVSYTSPDPEKATEVVTALATAYIEANAQERKKQAWESSEFLQLELEKVETRLQQKEEEVLSYKRSHMGELPEQMEANVATLTVLQKQMEVAAQNLTQARERQNALSRIADTDRVVGGIELEGAEKYKETPREAATRKLIELKHRFSDKHPDVVRLKKQILAMETEEVQQPLSPLPGGTPAVSAVQQKPSALQLEQVDLTGRIANASTSLVRIQDEIALYKRRIENTPKREQELVALTRDYATAKDMYASLLKRLEEARLANSLEQLQKAERFRLLEPALYPQQAAGPQRIRLFLLGCALSLGAAGGAAVLLEILDSSIHRVEELREFTTAPILGVIPQIVTVEDLRKNRLYQIYSVAALVAAMVGLVGVSYTVAVGNEQLVRLLVRPVSGIQI